MARPEWIEVGRIVRAHGVHGEVRIVSESDNPERFLPGSVLYARPVRSGLIRREETRRVRLTIQAVRGEDDFPIVRFEGVTDRGKAEALRGFVLEIEADQLPELEEDEFYPFDLEGLEVRHPEGLRMGQVAEVLDCPAHAVLVIDLEGGGQEMVPFVAAAIQVVDVRSGYLVVEPTFLAGSECVGRSGVVKPGDNTA